ncbi:D-isomer specific 2-hydroxyacid dehydrogenase [Penicillium capsulatum]|uniref:D-isomer specific 2-hydroxyacid dehydrogenase n=1 Tax=Penicillium capsulatum TaxID=69766 RepID=A0A9W9IFQ6_9EURO|nr:D-isomer specific 2-hydroxyacid dehydrogenase [Penicillium capsulatum]KAJ6135492.1 D-isomer specific 2-hydroxyacid dehydrogenase [Penicillium capsulatum]
MAPSNPHIVAIEAIHCQMPDFDIPHSLSVHKWTQASELADRIKDATVIITTTIRLTARELDPSVTPRLQLIVAMATGTDHIDKAAAKARGIVVCNCPGSNIQSVSDHALGLYFATRRKLPILNQATTTVLPAPASDTEWKLTGSLRDRLRMSDSKGPLLSNEETMGIIGFGALGKRIAQMGQALGMTILAAERKGVSPRADRTAFEDVLKQSTVLVVTVPRSPETMDLISSDELRMMPPQALLLNVARGGIVNEAALLAALKEGSISGAATDVFEKEPAGQADSPLLGPQAEGLNLVLTPHLAWYAESTLTHLQRSVRLNVENWYAGKITNEITC